MSLRSAECERGVMKTTLMTRLSGRLMVQKVKKAIGQGGALTILIMMIMVDVRLGLQGKMTALGGHIDTAMTKRRTTITMERDESRRGMSTIRRLIANDIETTTAIHAIEADVTRIRIL